MRAVLQPRTGWRCDGFKANNELPSKYVISHR